jgi:hypothetical protein
MPAQSPLTTMFGGNVGSPAAVVEGGTLFFDLAVSSPITVTRLDVNLTQACVGRQGTIEFYRTVPGVVSHRGVETTAAMWQLLATATVDPHGQDVASPACLPQPVTLLPGSAGYAVVHLGVAPAYSYGTPANVTWSNAELKLTAGAAAFVAPLSPDGSLRPFVFAALGPRVWNGALHYEVGPSAPACAYNAAYGRGCGGTFASFFDLVEDSAAATARLAGRSLLFVPDSFPAVGRYTVVQGPGAIVDPSNHPILLGFVSGSTDEDPVDEGEALVPVPGAGFPYPGGSTNSLFVHTNGLVAAGSLLPHFDHDAWTPCVDRPLSLPHAVWCSWHDWDAGTAGACVRAFDTGTRILVTWEHVASRAGGPGSPGTFQFAFDYTTGQVEMTWGPIGPGGGPHLIGFSSAGPSVRPEGEIDAAGTGLVDLVSAAEEHGSLTLTAWGRPLIGATVSLALSTPPASILGMVFASTTALPGPGVVGLDLGFLGAPGCSIHVDPMSLCGALLPSSGGQSFSFAADPALAGLRLHLQGMCLDASANTLGVVTSNAVEQFWQVN